VLFAIDKPCTISLEIDGDLRRPLFLFADPAGDEPAPGDGRVRRFKGGMVHEAGVMDLDDGETVFIEEGAVVRGAVRSLGKNNITLCDRGILDGSRFGRMDCRMAQVENCRGFTVRDVMIANGRHWEIVPVNCDSVSISGVRIVSNADCDDGMDIVGCRDVRIRGCFVRTKDDCIAIKANRYNWMQATGVDCDVDNVHVSDSVFWR